MCNPNCDYEKCFEFDFIENTKIPKFTKKNLALINTFLKYNSSYSAAENADEGSYAQILKDNTETFFCFEKPADADEKTNKDDIDENGKIKTKLYRVIESIDKINSTHLASEGGGKRNENEPKKNKGRVYTEEVIRNIDNIKERLMEGDPQIVFEIASAVGTKYNFSFATKFCTYVSELALERPDLYCIYDDVVQAILPIYIYYYVGTEKAKEYYKVVNKSKPELRRIESTVSQLKSKDKENGYAEYRDLIDEIIKGIKEKDGLEVTYSEFDHILWYYFKGSKQKIQEALNTME